MRFTAVGTLGTWKHEVTGHVKRRKEDRKAGDVTARQQVWFDPSPVLV